MNTIFFSQGLEHVLDINGYDHVLFLIALVAVYIYTDWKKVLAIVTSFTIGHTISLALAAYNVVGFNSAVIEFLIPVTIFLTAGYNLINNTKTNHKQWILLLSALAFGIIHGFGFSSYFQVIIGNESSKLWPLIQFALGIEVSQLIVVSVVLILAWLVQSFFKVSKRDWAIVLSAMVLGAVIPMIIESDIW